MRKYTASVLHNMICQKIIAWENECMTFAWTTLEKVIMCLVAWHLPISLDLLWRQPRVTTVSRNIGVLFLLLFLPYLAWLPHFSSYFWVFFCALIWLHMDQYFVRIQFNEIAHLLEQHSNPPVKLATLISCLHSSRGGTACPLPPSLALPLPSSPSLRRGILKSFSINVKLVFWKDAFFPPNHPTFFIFF